MVVGKYFTNVILVAVNAVKSQGERNFNDIPAHCQLTFSVQHV
jgi:hypothetical protein